jgi:hypothetical protein
MHEVYFFTYIFEFELGVSAASFLPYPIADYITVLSLFLSKSVKIRYPKKQVFCVHFIIAQLGISSLVFLTEPIDQVTVNPAAVLQVSF